MNETTRWVKDGVVQNGYVEGATAEVVESSVHVAGPVDVDRNRLDLLRAKGALSAAEQAEAVVLMLKLW